MWGVLGGIAEATERLRVGTAVTCPLVRVHPLIVAQAAATAAVQLEDRFFLGLGSGEYLNEHVLGDPWPPAEVRLEQLEEAIDLIRTVWAGETESFRGAHYRVDEARLYTRPETPPPIYVAASGPRAARVAAERGDGIIGTSPDPEMLARFGAAGGAGRPRLGQLHVCVAASEEEGRVIAARCWPNAGLGGNLSWELKTPELVASAVEPLPRDARVGSATCGPDAEAHVAAIRAYLDAGYDHVWVHQVGADQEAFFSLYEREVLPALRASPDPRAVAGA